MDNNILQGLMNMVGENGLSAIGEKAGLDKSQTSSALEAAIPTILSALTSNASSKAGARSLDNALAKDHDGSILNNVLDFIQNSEQGPGKGILKHTLGSRRTEVEHRVSQKSGISANSVGKILEIAGPLILGYLGRKKREESVSSNGLFDLLGSFTNQANNNSSFDLTDIIGMFANGDGKKQSGGLLGGLLSTFLGGRK